MHSYDVSNLQRKTSLFEQHLKTVLEPLLFQSLMEIERLQKSLRIAHANIKKLEARLPKQEGEQEQEQLIETEQNIPQMNPNMQNGNNPMLSNPNMQRNRNTVPLNGNMNQTNMVPNNSGFLANPLVQNAIANNPILSQQFQGNGGNRRNQDPMEVIKRMKQSANQSKINN